MPPLCRAPQDVCTGHGCYPSRACAAGSPDVITNNLQSHRQGDPWKSHCCPPCHSSVLAAGSPTVYTNNKGQGRVGDPVACGGNVATGSPNVNVGP